MKTKSLSVSIALVFCTSMIFGQEYTFKVLVNKGKNEVKSGPDWEPIKVGASLKSPDEVKISENAYLGLIHVSGKPLEIKHAGNYKVIDLSAKVGKGSSVLNKYTDFILSNNTEKRNTMAATGAVHRGFGDVKVFLPPSASYVFGDSISIAWESDKSAAPPYIITFTTLFGVELDTIETSANTVSVNLNDSKFANENDIIVRVRSKAVNKESEGYILRKFGRADKERISASFSDIATETETQTALNSLIRASFFEQNKLLADAVTAYQKAINLEPEVVAYRESYDDFLIRNGLKMPPEKK